MKNHLQSILYKRVSSGHTSCTKSRLDFPPFPSVLNDMDFKNIFHNPVLESHHEQILALSRNRALLFRPDDLPQLNLIISTKIKPKQTLSLEERKQIEKDSAWLKRDNGRPKFSRGNSLPPIGAAVFSFPPIRPPRPMTRTSRSNEPRPQKIEDESETLNHAVNKNGGPKFLRQALPAISAEEKTSSTKHPTPSSFQPPLTTSSPLRASKISTT